MQHSLLRIIDVFLEGANRPLIVVLGPTASGKTGLSLNIADHVCGEVVNADSRQLFRHLDIGTAKIRSDEMRGIHHHLIDVKNPDDEVTVAWYQVEANRIIQEIQSRAKVPILTGGSMLYLSSVIDGLSLAGNTDSVIRSRLETLYDADGGETLMKKLRTVDPDAAAFIHRNNKPYVIRALEIYEIHGKPKTAMIQPKKCDYDLLIVGVERSPEDLRKRIVDRIDAMIESGWIQEVRELIARGYDSKDPGMQSLGYREIMRYIQELESSASDMNGDEMMNALKKEIEKKTRKYVKRQLTWWRGDLRILWMHILHSPHPNFPLSVS